MEEVKFHPDSRKLRVRVGKDFSVQARALACTSTVQGFAREAPLDRRICIEGGI